MNEVFLKTERYEIVNPPQADTDELAAQGKRIIVYHNKYKGRIILHEVERGVVYAGWVIGLIRQ